MDMMHEMRRLRAEHTDLVRLAGDLRRLTAAPTPPPIAELVAAGDALRETLIRHLKCEDWALYPRLTSSGDDAAGRLARAFIAEMGHIADDFIAYDRRWTPARVVAEWPAFRAETDRLLDTLAIRIAREEGELYPIAEALPSARRAARARVSGRGW